MILTFELIILGLLTGVITGITGASGVLIVVPILSTLFDIPLPIVLGTSLLVDVVVSAAVSVSYGRNRHIDYKTGVYILVGSLIGAQIGSFFVVSVSKILINAVLAACMVFFGVNMWRSGVTKRPPRMIALPENLAEKIRHPLPMSLFGLLVGLSTGIFGAGGGLIIFIILYSILREPLKESVGTSVFIMLLTALSGAFGYFWYGNMDIEMGLTIGIFAAIGGFFSSVVANRIREDILARFIAVFFLLLASVMLSLRVFAPLYEIYYQLIG
jgi:hypothetical protein